MSDSYTEPTNEQLANFMSVYASRIPALGNLAISPAVLEHIFNTREDYRQVALKHHRTFQGKINVLSTKITQGLLQCEHILLRGKQCPNYNQPGSPFCGLHQDEESNGAEQHSGPAVSE